MAEWGFGSWNADGTPNNYGIKPISLIGKVNLSSGQKTGSYSFSVPAGFKLAFLVGLAPAVDTYQPERRTININGSSLVIGSASNNSIGSNVYVADQNQVVVFLEKV